MREYSPGASVNNNYAWHCDNCQVKDGRAVLLWPLPNNNHFALCLKCLGSLYSNHVLFRDKSEEKIIVKRLVVSEKLRNKVFNRDGNRCLKCGSQLNLSIDHIVPFSRGGGTTEANLQTLCLSCNISKGAKA